MNNTTQERNERKIYKQGENQHVVQHSVNIKTCRGRQYLQFYYWRSAFISRSASDANTLQNRFSDAELRTKKLMYCLFIISVTNGRLKAVQHSLITS